MKQLTLSLIKQDVYANKDKVLKEIKDNFKVLAYKEIKMKRIQAEDFYKEHKGKFFYPRLVNFMSRGTTIALILEGEDSISRWRKMMGPTHLATAKMNAPESIRAKYAFSDTRNAVHGSDSQESASREIQFFFPEIKIESI
eukprot:TRINITY_DN15857_c0_g1_i1.p1 TRINITY_DN15857_c0_g1~~TRINITY_DN15857_c0_g1_i1.p1  ORF type:complete len:141 (-),score=25.83 TRINITY_DN15857_c0_g1_i1:35-457(-)